MLDADGAELGVNDDSDGSLNSRLDFVPQSAGDVFVEAGGYASAQTGVYTLSVTAEALPEDNIAAATNTRGRINLGQSLDGALDFPGDRDWYRIRLTEGQSYRFTMISAGDAPLDDTLVKIYNSRGEELAMDDDGGEGFNSYLEFTAPSTGNYFVEARGFNDQATGSYTLAAHDGDIPADSSTDATLAASGDFREGVLSPAGDRDWYRVDLEEGQAFRLALNSAEGAPDALADPYVVLYGPDGAELARDDDGGEGLNSWLEFQATASGPHYIEVRGFVEDAQGRYQLTLIPGEIGDSAEGAEYLTPNGQGRASVIGQVGDVDWFVIETIEARPYRIYLDAVDPNPLDDPMLTLYNEQGEQILMDDDGGTGLNSRIEYASPTGGPIFAVVSSYAGAGSGSYFIRLTDTEVPGHIYTDETLEAQDDARMSRIDMPGDLDYYRVELEGGVRYVISVSGEGATPLADPFLAVVDAQNERVASDDDSGDGRDARLRFTPPQSGTYFLQASGLGRTTGDYRIGIMRQ
ncbi:MAG: PPC domain-containing protein [Hyphomonadaceae bacterium]